MPDDLPFTEFGLTPEDKNLSARLVLTGDKRATTSLRAAYDYDRDPLPVVGRRSIVRDGRGRNVATIKTIRIEIKRFCDVDATYAAIEGEGNKSLAEWQRLHWHYLSAECARVGVPLSETLEVVLDYFEVEEAFIALRDF